MVNAHERIIVALDVPTLDQAEELASALAPHVGWFKVGLELFSAHGPEAVQRIRRHGPVFLDLKLHDIPTTVERAAARLSNLGVGLLTVHAAGGTDMVAGAVAGFGDGGRILAVTMLTSLSEEDARAVGMPSASGHVPTLAALATSAGAPGLVCSPHEVTAVREVVGPDVLLVTPGIRPTGSSADDQSRAATPASALAAGSDLLVIGRPITRADDPVAAADAITSELLTV